MAHKEQIFCSPGLGLAPSPRATGGKAYGFIFLVISGLHELTFFYSFPHLFLNFSGGSHVPQVGEGKGGMSAGDVCQTGAKWERGPQWKQCICG